MDGDRYPELLIAADLGKSNYYRNDRGGTFSEVTVAGTGNMLYIQPPRTPLHGVGGRGRGGGTAVAAGEPWPWTWTTTAASTSSPPTAR